MSILGKMRINSGRLAEILAEFSEIDESKFYRTRWLRSTFQDDVWECNFGKTNNVLLDYRIYLPDGELLTSVKHQKLLRTIKHWIIVHTNFDIKKGALRQCDFPRLYHLFCDVVQLIDYLLLDANSLRFHDHGLESLTQGEIKRTLKGLSTSSTRADSIYRWPAELAKYLRKKISTLDIDVDAFLCNNPSLGTGLPIYSQRKTGLSDEELIKSRIWLFTNGFFKRATERRTEATDYKLALATIPLSKLVYANTLRGRTQKYQLPEFRIGVSTKRKRQHPAAEIRNRDTAVVARRRFEAHCQALASLKQLSELGLQVPEHALEALEDKEFLKSLATKHPGRYATLPVDVAMIALRRAIEIIILDGELIVNSYANQLCKDWHLNSHLSKEEPQSDTDRPFAPDCKIKLSRNARTMHDWSHSTRGYHPDVKTTTLSDAFKILTGAVIVCVGSLVARRQQELTKLYPHNCLEKASQGFYLKFENGKSGTLNIRETLSRPIPDIAARSINLFKKFQDKLIYSGVISAYEPVFSRPKLKGSGFRSATAHCFNDALDLFCDHVGLTRNEAGRRFYIREHQLRRFFAQVFFWNFQGDSDTLRWFLGHTDVEHLYHYVTEAMPGGVLRGVKSEYIQERLREDSDEYSELKILLRERFGTDDYSLLDSSELDLYLEDLMQSGTLTVEPFFIENSDGKSYRILVHVR